MRLKILVASIALLSSHAFAQSTYTTSYWETTEYSKSRVLPSINASSAYALGYTGKGSTIAILDSGIVTSSPEFLGRITATKDFTGTGIQDTLGHGTHVAGIAAAANNGIGVEGVAFDANLLVGKITSGGIITVPSILQGLSWAANNNATVANLSLSFALPANLNPVQIAPGIYSTTLTNTGNLPSGFNAAQWAAAMPGQMIVVVAAGNDGAKTPGSQGSLATATDSLGKLILGGRMIIAGDWNEQTNRVNSSSNLAGSLCAKTVNGVCQDRYLIKDFYLLAPGSSITSTVPTSVNATGLANMTGSSMSAAVISGAAAILRQQWPQLSGDKIAQILLQTANKSIAGYDPNTMGQGLLDLKRATMPVGSLTMPVAGSNVYSSSGVTPGVIIVSGGGVSTAKLSSVMLLDSYRRDFYAPGKAFTAVAPSIELNIKQASMPYMSRNGYSLFNNYNDYQNVKLGDIEMSSYRDTTYNVTNGSAPMMIEMGYTKRYDTANVKFTAGGFTENNTWLGNSFGGSINSSQSFTAFTGIGVERKFETGTQLYGSITHGITNVQATSSYITNMQPVLSYSWNLGVEQALTENHSVGMMLYQPVTVYHAMANSNIPVGLDSNFNVITAGRINLAADITEYRAGAYYKLREKDYSSVMAFVENRQNYKGQAGVTDNVFGVVANYKF